MQDRWLPSRWEESLRALDQGERQSILSYVYPVLWQMSLLGDSHQRLWWKVLRGAPNMKMVLWRIT